MMRRIISAIVLCTSPVYAGGSVALSDALTAAVSNSPNVAAANARVREFQSLFAAAKGDGAPAVTGSYAQLPQGSQDGTIAQRLTTIGASMDLTSAFARDAAVSAASADLQSAELAYADAVRLERIKTIGLFFDVLRARADTAVRSAQLAAAKSDLRAAQQRHDLGDAPHLDVTRAQVALSQALGDQTSANVAAENAESALENETGTAPVNPLSPPIETAPLSANAAIQSALAHRADILQARGDVVATQAAARVAEKLLLPDVVASVGYTAGVDAGVPVHGPSGSLTMALPISSQKRSQLEAAQARVTEATLRVKALERDVATDVAAQVRTITMLRFNLMQDRRAEDSASKELYAVEAGYKIGASSSLDIVEARRTYLEAALSRTKAEYDLQQSISTLRETTSL